MQEQVQNLKAFFLQHKQVIKVELTEVLGSSPRNAGTIMYVSQNALWGTIGGGQLEFILIERARELLASKTSTLKLDIPLGPEIGQCCGGRVSVRLKLMNRDDLRCAYENEKLMRSKFPHVYILGAGHVGRAIASQMQHLPVQCVIIDSREEELSLCDAKVEIRHSAIPEVDIQDAPPGSAFIILTHDHGLDFLLASTALARQDAAYVGMIGSATKRAKFINWCRENYEPIPFENLQCPIGANGSRDKRPSVIAAFVTAEIIAELTYEPVETFPEKGFDLPERKQLTGGDDKHERQTDQFNHTGRN